MNMPNGDAPQDRHAHRWAESSGGDVWCRACGAVVTRRGDPAGAPAVPWSAFPSPPLTPEPFTW